MAVYRDNLPQLGNQIFLTDGGIETTLIFQYRLELPFFAAFPLLHDDRGLAALKEYYKTYSKLAVTNNMGFILESPTWRASSFWGSKLGYTKDDLAKVNLEAILFLEEIRNRNENEYAPMVISGCVGPRDDAYNPSSIMSEREAWSYHAVQIDTFAKSNADMITALTMTNTAEAIGIVKAAREEGMPVVISFTTETNGTLTSKETLKDAIVKVDQATDGYPAYYMINDAHPSHFAKSLKQEPWVGRIRGIRANPSAKSRAELDCAQERDRGNPKELAALYRVLKDAFPHLNIFGGSCGIDEEHLQEIIAALQAPSVEEFLQQ